MRTYLVVAHHTLVDEHVLAHVTALAREQPTSFHLVVPVSHPIDHAWTDGEVQAVARQRLEVGLAAFGERGLDVTGEVGDANPVYAVGAALRGAPDTEWAGILVSTLPLHLSRWLRIDAVSRIRREYPIPVTHLAAEAPAET